MGILTKIISDFIFFSLIESYIYSLFFKSIKKKNKLYLREILLLGLINSTISILFPPVVYQILIIIILSIDLYIFNKNKILDSFTSSVFCITYLMILEIFYSLIMSALIGVDSFRCDDFELFLLIIPLRIIEILTIRKGDFLMKNLKIWIGEVEKPEVKEENEAE